MRISPTNENVNFQHRILIDIGASNPKGTLKIKALTNSGKEILKENSPNSYLNNTVKGFNGGKDFVEKLYNIVRRTHERVLLKHKSGEFPLSPKDLLLAGVAIFVPGTTYALDGKSNIISFMPNLKDKQGNSLTNIDFADYKDFVAQKQQEDNIKFDKDNFKFVVTKDLGGSGVALARLMAHKKMLKEGDYIMGVMTGGGFGSVDIKIKNNSAEFETSESSSYVAGNFEAYDKIAGMIDGTLNSGSPREALEKIKENRYKFLKDNVQLLGKLGRQGVNVKSHIETFCNEIGRPDLIGLLQAIGDARIVEMNRLCVSEKDTELLERLRSLKDDFREIESTTDGKIAFELREDGNFDKETLKNGRTVAVNAYANAISLISINKINDCVNKVVLLGPFAHGVNQYVKTHSEDFDGAKDLPELIRNKILTNVDKDHIDLPSTRRLMDLYKFEIICDPDLNFPDNTAAGDLFLDPKFKFIHNRGSWFSLPLSVLKS